MLICISRKIVTALILVPLICAAPALAWAKTIEELRLELNDKRKSLQQTEENIKKFKEDIQAKRQEARTLEDQIGLIDDSLTEIQLNIARTKAEITATDAEIEALAEEILLKEEEIGRQKTILAEYIRMLNQYDQQSSVTIFLKYQTFSEALTESAAIKELQNRGQETLVRIQNLYQELVTKRRELNDFRQSLEALRIKQQQQENALSAQRTAKQRILELTSAQEAQYSSLLSQAQQAHKDAEATIKALDATIREELRQQGIGNLPSVGILDWPIDPIFGASCEFHCAGYPYEYLIGPHSGLDLPTYVGTPIKAPADGYVARTFDSGGAGYSYVLLIHGDNVSTVYGHVSGFAANEGQLVTRGTVIGYTGGAPGTRGAGLSSGPHLHFEVRQNNLPVNPRNFL